MYYLTDFCCLCLECNKNVTSQISISFNARKIMEYVIPESVLQKSEIPIQVCDDCLDNLNNFFKFKQSCLDNVNTFSEYVQKLVAKHGPHNYLSVKTNAISLQNEMCSEIYENVENSGKICDTTIKTEILEDEHDSSSPLNTNESNMSLEQVLIKVEDAVDDLYVKDEINEELIIKDDLFESDSNAELAPIHDVLRITAPSNTTDQNDIAPPFTAEASASKKPYKCDVCQKTFPKNSKLVIHSRVHTGEKLFQCDACQKPFTSARSLKRHKLMHGVDSPYACDICQQTFTERHELIRHKNTHPKLRPYTCELCNKGFTRFYHLTVHKRIHFKDKRYKCDVCNKLFTQSSSLKKHSRLHTGDRPYQCDVCHKAFAELSTLYKHTRSHTKETPYQCDGCEKSFMQLNSLKQHKLVHTDSN